MTGMLLIWIGGCCAGQVLVRGVLFVCYAVFGQPEVDWLLFVWKVLVRGWMGGCWAELVLTVGWCLSAMPVGVFICT